MSHRLWNSIIEERQMKKKKAKESISRRILYVYRYYMDTVYEYEFVTYIKQRVILEDA